MAAALAHLQGEHEVAADVLLGDDVLHGPERGAQIGVEKLGGQQAHRGGHQVVWQRHVCDLIAETRPQTGERTHKYHKHSVEIHNGVIASMTPPTFEMQTHRLYSGFLVG